MSSETFCRLPPHDLESEQVAIGCMLQWPAVCIPEAQAALTPEFFYDLRHQMLFEAICGVYERSGNVDLVTLSASLRANGVLESCGGVVYLNQACELASSSHQLAMVVPILIEHQGRRRILTVATEMISAAYDSPENSGDLASAAIEQLTQQVQSHTGVEMGADQIVDAYMESCEAGEPLRVMRTGFPSLDTVYTPKAGDLYLIAARPSVGKSALAGSIAVRMITASPAYRVGSISLEMTPESLAHRMIAQMSGIPVRVVCDPASHQNLVASELNRLSRAAATLRGCPMRFSRSRGMTIDRICSLAKHWSRRYGLDALIVDYVGLIPNPPRARDRTEGVGQISAKLKDLAMDLGIVVFALCQINREAGDPAERPRIHHLRDSGSLEQDADVVLLLQRHVRPSGVQGVFAHLDKARNGPTANGIFLPFNGPTCSFSDEMFQGYDEPA